MKYPVLLGRKFLSKKFIVDTAKKNIDRMYAREYSHGPIDESVVNGEYIENNLNGGYKDPFRKSCQIPNTNINFVNSDIKIPPANSK